MRINDPKKAPFGKMLRGHGVIMEWVAKAHVEIDAARLLILNAAIKIDQGGAKSALKKEDRAQRKRNTSNAPQPAVQTSAESLAQQVAGVRRVVDSISFSYQGR